MLERPAVIAEDIELIHSVKSTKVPYRLKIIGHPIRGTAIIKLVASDQPEMLWKLAAAVSLQGANITRVRIYSRRKNLFSKKRIGIYKLFVEGLDLQSSRRVEDGFSTLFAMDDRQAQEEISKKRPKFVVPKAEPKITFDSEGSDRFTIVDIISPDRMFLLYDINRVLADYGNLYVLLVHTDKGIGINSFYLLGPDGLKITDRKWAEIEMKLLEALNGKS